MPNETDIEKRSSEISKNLKIRQDNLDEAHGDTARLINEQIEIVEDLVGITINNTIESNPTSDDFEVGFSHLSVFPLDLGNVIPSGKKVNSISIDIIQIFDGTNINSFTIGDGVVPDRFTTAVQFVASHDISSGSNPNEELTAPTQMKLYSNISGQTQGSGVIRVEVI